MTATKRLCNTAFFRKYGILTIILLAVVIWTAAVWLIASAHAKSVTTAKLTAKYEKEYADKVQAFEKELIAANTPTEDEQLARQISKEADIIAKAIGTMNTKQMKLSMLWNILMRVDSPYYPNSVSEVVNQPSQWMFYKDSNPIRDDDVALAKEQLALWHAGRYPAGLSDTFVYGQWSEHDYVLRDTWEQNYKTKYWRFPE